VEVKNDIEKLVERLSGPETAENCIGALSCSEQIAAAFLFNRMDWLPSGYEHPLDALDRLGEKWLALVLAYHREHSP
jgi:hypothetical protein